MFQQSLKIWIVFDAGLADKVVYTASPEAESQYNGATFYHSHTEGSAKKATSSCSWQL